MSLLVGQAPLVAQFVSLAVQGRHIPWGEYNAFGWEEKGKLVAGVVYNHFTECSVCMHIGAVPGRKWLKPEFLFAAFDWPFREMGLARVTGLVPVSNMQARKFDENLGFTLEGELRRALPGGESLLIYGMLKEECRWIAEPFSKYVWKRLQLRLPPQSVLVH